MSTRTKIREWLATQEGPQWSCEIIAGTGCKSTDITRMVCDGTLIRHDSTPVGYSIGRLPRITLTPEQRIERRREFDRRRDAIRKRKAQPKVTRAKVRRPKVHEPAMPKGAAPSVAEFIRQGGQIERLPSFQFDGVYAQRRPQMGAGVRTAA